MFSFQDVMSSVSNIRGGVPVKRLSKKVRLGTHKSVFFGPSYNLVDVREYDQERDSENLIVWSLYDPEEKIIWARKTIEEHEIQIRFFIDLSSSSVDSGRKFIKKRMLLEAVGFLGMTGAKYQDQVGLVGFTDRIVMDMRPRGGVMSFVHFLKVLYEYLDEHGVDGKDIEIRETDFVVMLDYMRKTLNKACFIPIFSDFVGFEKIFESKESLRLLKYLASRHEIIFIFIDDPDEIASAVGRGYIREEDIETGKQIVIPRLRRKLEENLMRIRKERTILRKRKLKQIGIDSVVIEPGKQITRLQKFFIKRQRSSI
jgi:uncharacterized protein (DUF58 family)